MVNVKISANRRANYKWTLEQDAVLREMFALGMSYGEIAKAIHVRCGTRYDETAVANHGYLMGLRRPGPRPVLVWSADQNEELRQRVANRERYIDIGKAMAIKPSAIATQVYRLNIPRPARQVSDVPTKSRADHAYAVTQALLDRHLKRRLNALMNVVPAEYVEPEPFDAKPDPVSDPRNITLAQLERLDCHWITNNDTAAPRYCGHAVDGGKGSWCPAHHDVIKRATVPFNTEHIKWIAATEERRKQLVEDKVPAARHLSFNSGERDAPTS